MLKNMYGDNLQEIEINCELKEKKEVRHQCSSLLLDSNRNISEVLELKENRNLYQHHAIEIKESEQKKQNISTHWRLQSEIESKLRTLSEIIDYYSNLCQKNIEPYNKVQKQRKQLPELALESKTNLNEQNAKNSQRENSLNAQGYEINQTPTMNYLKMKVSGKKLCQERIPITLVYVVRMKEVLQTSKLLFVHKFLSMGLLLQKILHQKILFRSDFIKQYKQLMENSHGLSNKEQKQLISNNDQLMSRCILKYSEKCLSKMLDMTKQDQKKYQIMIYKLLRSTIISYALYSPSSQHLSDQILSSTPKCSLKTLKQLLKFYRNLLSRKN